MIQVDRNLTAYGANSTSSSKAAYGGLMTGSARSEYSMGRQPRGCVPRFVEKERRPPLRHQGIRSGGNLRVFENLAQTLVAVDAP